jgi:hypothetical protein
LGTWLLAGQWETENWRELASYIDGAAFTHRVWSAAAWILCPLVGLSTLAARRAIVSRAADGGPQTAAADEDL